MLIDLYTANDYKWNILTTLQVWWFYKYSHGIRAIPRLTSHDP
jgi:hypothetical protein